MKTKWNNKMGSRSRKAIWFSRHAPTEDQLSEIAEMGYELGIEVGENLGSTDIGSEGDLDKLLSALQAQARQAGAAAVFGVYPVPLQACLYYGAKAGGGIICYGAWNVRRTVEGERPTFKHLKWCSVGALLPGGSCSQ